MASKPENSTLVKRPRARNSLVVIACSNRKRRNPKEAIPAIDRYDGVFYKVLRKSIREGRIREGTTIAILSAKYGLILSETPIRNYDKRLTATAALKMKPTVQAHLREVIRKNHITTVMINVGQDYAPALENLPETATAIWAQGPIGKRAAILKHWLAEGSPGTNHRSSGRHRPNA